MSSLRAATVVLVFPWLVACQDGGSGSHPDSGSNHLPVPLSELTVAAPRAQCEQEVRCGGSPDVTTCLASRRFWWDQLIAGVSAGRTLYDANAAAECLDALRSKGCNRTDLYGPVDPPECVEAFRGTGAAGATCFINADCISSFCYKLICPSTVACCAGTCDPPFDPSNPVPLGGDCSAPSAVCASGLACDRASSIPTCVVGLLAGQECDPNDSKTTRCLNGVDCEYSPSANAYTCTPLPSEGEACEESPAICNSYTNFCDPASQRCVPKIAVGQPCQNNYSCVEYANCVSGTCVSLKRAGEACDGSQTVAQCLGGLACSNGVCTLPGPWPVCP